MTSEGIFAAANAHLSDDETVAKMGHPVVVVRLDVDHRHPIVVVRLDAGHP
jgi:hypothetical protein